MKIKLLFFLTFLTQVVFSQSKISIGIFASPELKKEYSNFLNFNPIIRYTLGISVRYNCTQRIYFITGLWFNKKGFSSKFDFTYANSKYNGATNIISVQNYLEMPFLFGIKSRGNKIYFLGSLGPSLGYLLSDKFSYTPSITMLNGSQTSTIKSTRTELISNGYQNLYINLVLNTGLGIALTEKIHLCLEPNIQYTLTNTMRDKYDKAHYASLGIRATVWRYF